MRFIMILLATLALVGCGARGEFVQISEIPAERAALVDEQGVTEAVFVGTTRTLDPETADYGYIRSEAVSFMRYDIYVPKARPVGEVVWPRSAAYADPSTDFLTRSVQKFSSGGDFSKSLKSAMKARNQNEIVLYVHGFNNTMAEGIYRVAQMHYDLKVPGVAVHYAWPSRGSALGYVYDRDSALYARDGLEKLLEEVVAAGAARIVIVGHSMGSAITMETLRQIAIRGDIKLEDRIAGVMLISPDVDVDVFRSQARTIGKLPQPFVIFGNRKDTVLGLSSRLSGAPDRLGNLKDLAPLGDLEVTYMDTAAYSQGAGHFNVGSSPALISLLSGVEAVDASFRAEAAARVGLLPGAVLSVRNATSIVLAPVESIARRN